MDGPFIFGIIFAHLAAHRQAARLMVTCGNDDRVGVLVDEVEYGLRGAVIFVNVVNMSGGVISMAETL